MEITEATDNHIPEILEIWKEFMDFHKDIDPRFARSENGHLNFEKHLTDVIGSEDAQALVVLDKSHVVGYSIAETGKDPPVFERQNYGE